MSKLPTVPVGSTGVAKPAQSLVSKPREGGPPAPSMDATIARLRVATGKPERRTLFYTCSNHRTAFTATYERTDPRARFTLATITQAASSGGNGDAATAASASRAPEAFRSEEFDTHGFACPSCKAAGTIYDHACGVTFCNGARQPIAGGGYRFTCPGCGTTGTLTATDTMRGNTATVNRPSPERNDKRIGGPEERLRLPGRSG